MPNIQCKVLNIDKNIPNVVDSKIRTSLYKKEELQPQLLEIDIDNISQMHVNDIILKKQFRDHLQTE